MRTDFQRFNVLFIVLSLVLNPCVTPCATRSAVPPTSSLPLCSREALSPGLVGEQTHPTFSPARFHVLDDIQRIVSEAEGQSGHNHTPDHAMKKTKPSAPESKDVITTIEFLMQANRLPVEILRPWINQVAELVKPDDSILHVAEGLYGGNRDVRFIWAVEALLGAKVILSDLAPESLSSQLMWLANESFLAPMIHAVQIDRRSIDLNRLSSLFMNQKFDQVDVFNLFSYAMYDGNPLEALAELFSRVKPGGRIVATDDYVRIPKRHARLALLIPELASQWGLTAEVVARGKWIGLEAPVVVFRVNALDKQIRRNT